MLKSSLNSEEVIIYSQTSRKSKIGKMCSLESEQSVIYTYYKFSLIIKWFLSTVGEITI